MEIDLNNEIEIEIELLKQDLIDNCGFEHDTGVGILYIEAPYRIEPDNLENRIIITPNPEFLDYTNTQKSYDRLWIKKQVPWIAFHFDLNKNLTDNERLDILKWLSEKINQGDYKPFKDEDAEYYYFTKPISVDNNYYRYKFYLNTDYPKGFGDNHTL